MAHPSPLCPMTVAGSGLLFVVDNIPDAEIKPSPVHGNGLYATRDFRNDEVLAWLDGQVVNWDSWEQTRDAMPFGQAGDELFMEWNALTTDTLLIRPFRTKYSFINHDRSPNLVLQADPLRVVAARAVAAGEELTLDYRREPLRRQYLAEATWL